MAAIDRSIDRLNEKVGYLAALLSFPLVAVVALEVFMRYVVGSPTVWGFEATCFVFGVSWALGLALTHQKNGHVTVDFVEMRFGEVGRTRLRVLTNVLLFLPGNVLLAVGSITYAADAWANWEKNSTSWAPAIYPYKTAMALGFVLLLLQGVSKLLADLRFLRERRAAAALAPAGLAGDAP
jgi:TRAP-type mannitol/chloroaromatic compound transport system permease small subunit